MIVACTGGSEESQLSFEQKLENRSSSGHCVPSTVDCTQEFFGPVDIEYEDSGCFYRFFTITYYACPDGIKIVEPQGTRLPIPECDALEVILNQQGQVKVDEIAAFFSYEVEDIILDYVLNQEITVDFECDGSANCGGGSTTVDFIANGCYSYCYEQVVDLEGNIIGNITQYQCGESCCTRSTPFCFDGDEICKGEPVKTTEESCVPVDFECNMAPKFLTCSSPCNRI